MTIFDMYEVSVILGQCATVAVRIYEASAKCAEICREEPHVRFLRIMLSGAQ